MLRISGSFTICVALKRASNRSVNRRRTTALSNIVVRSSEFGSVCESGDRDNSVQYSYLP